MTGLGERARLENVSSAPPSDRELELNKLRPDLDVVRRYGASHPEEWVDAHFRREPPPLQLVVVISGDDIERHDAALRGLVAFPDQLEVRWSPHSYSYLEEIRAEASEMARKGSICGTSIECGRTHIKLWADQEGLASELAERYGDAVDLTVGYLHYPDRRLLKSGGTPLDRPVIERPPLLPADEIVVSVPQGLRVKSGDSLSSRLEVHNRCTAELVVKMYGQVTGSIVDPQSNQRVGGFEGTHTSPVVRFRASPGMSVNIPLRIGTACPDPDLGYKTPPGEWAIEVILNVDGRGRLRSPLLPVTVCPETEPWP
jgi:hypothetical protein